MTRSLEALGPVPDRLPVGPNTLSWRIGREPALLLGGGRALLLQVAHPLVAAGVEQHSNYQADPWTRLFSTLDIVFTMMFADAQASAKAALRLQRRHQVVKGNTEDGTPYNALDPDLLLWVWATLVDTAIVVYERSLGRLSDAERGRYLDEQKLFAYACGVPQGSCPQTFADFETYVDTVTREVLRPTKVARDVAESLRHPPLPVAIRLATAGPVNLVTAGLLPASLRDGLGYAWGPRQERALRATFAAARVQRLVPAALRTLPVTIAARREAPLKPPRWLLRQA